MAKKQTRRSISVSRTTYERLKAFCEANNVSMSQFVETRVGDFLNDGTPVTLTPTRPAPVASSMGSSFTTHSAPPAPRPMMMPSQSSSSSFSSPASIGSSPAPVAPRVEAPRPAPAPQPVPMTSAAARFAVEPPPPIIKPRPERNDTSAPKPAEKRPDQIFTF